MRPGQDEFVRSARSVYVEKEYVVRRCRVYSLSVCRTSYTVCVYRFIFPVKIIQLKITSPFKQENQIFKTLTYCTFYKMLHFSKSSYSRYVPVLDYSQSVHCKPFIILKTRSNSQQIMKKYASY